MALTRYYLMLLCMGCAQGGVGTDGGSTRVDGNGFPSDTLSDVTEGTDTNRADAPATDVIAPDAGPPSCVPLNAGTWRELGRASLASAPNADTFVAPDGTLARISLSGAPPSPRVEFFDAGVWQPLGVFPPTNANANVVGLAHDGDAFVAMWARRDGSVERPVVFRLTAGSWSELMVLGGGAPASTSVAGSASLWAAGGVVRVAGLEQLGDFRTREVVVAEHRVGATTALPNPQEASMGAFTPSLAQQDGALVLAWSEGNELQLARFDGSWTPWTTTGLFMGLPSNTRAASSAAGLWVAGSDFIDVNTNVVRLFRVDGETLTPTTGPFDRDPSTGPASVADMAVDTLGRAVLAMEEPAAAGSATRHVHVVRVASTGSEALGLAIDAVPGATDGTASLAIDRCDWPVLSVVEARAPGSTDYDVRTYRFED